MSGNNSAAAAAPAAPAVEPQPAAQPAAAPAPVTTGAAPAPGAANPPSPPAAPVAPAAPAADPKAEATPPAQASAVPEKYSLKLPEGSLLQASHLEGLEAFAKERGLSQEQAQALAERESATVGAFLDSEQKAFQERAAKWVDEVKADPEVGGAKFAESIEHTKRMLKQYAPPEFMKLLDDTGYGNHPALVKTLARVAKAMSDDKLVQTGVNAPSGPKPIEDVFYPAHSAANK